MKHLLEKIFHGSIVLETIDSPINSRIELLENLAGNRFLKIGGLIQSGKLVEKLWDEIFKMLFKENNSVKNCLILGLGAGSLVKVVSNYYPKVEILGIEIDENIITLGKKYFRLGDFTNLEIKKDDAFKKVEELVKQAEKFDLILVDLYLGDFVPEKSNGSKFLKDVKNCLKNKGVVVFNRLYYEKHIKKTDIFEQKLEQIFEKVEAKKVFLNKLFLCLKQGTKITF